MGRRVIYDRLYFIKFRLFLEDLTGGGYRVPQGADSSRSYFQSDDRLAVKTVPKGVSAQSVLVTDQPSLSSNLLK